jgi:putative spermidine/putrescine transport system ATP-binding protein
VQVTSVNGVSCEVDLGGGMIVPARHSQQVKLSSGEKVGLLLRPEMLRLAPTNADETPRLKGRIADEVYQGALRRYRVIAGEHEFVVEVPNRPELAQLSSGDAVDVFWSTESGVVVP